MRESSKWSFHAPSPPDPVSSITCSNLEEEGSGYGGKEEEEEEGRRVGNVKQRKR
jgi:hypothetical protein